METLTLNSSPQDSLRALERVMLLRSNWWVMTGGNPDQPRFVIEKQVRYNVLRGWNLTVLFQIIGSLQRNQNGTTTLQYTVSGQRGIPLVLAAINSVMLLLLAFAVGSLAFSPTMGNSLVGVLLIGFILLAGALYILFAYRSYQGHLQEMHRFMQEFAQARADGYG